MFAKVENGVTKSCQFFCRKNAGKTQFWAEIFHFFEQDRLLCARLDIGVTESPTKTAKKEDFFEGVSEILFSKVQRGLRIPFSVGTRIITAVLLLASALFTAAEKLLRCCCLFNMARAQGWSCGALPGIAALCLVSRRSA